ncbi:RimJ/RimL family protein N-acetyltransferase [Tamaricihabitans halophyticus]|uniref:RimJ/RimL family protein N-acetyltransferase n=1 Tax=Tamaricihabitans halophyticus TaxID=1262583 RepID=A0A4R2QNC4_9PSEU|nr:GNAT family N-acetyltransferase [Tamaricihabitans halophyticus]TCP50957.1 RimJ/RimL family protein N-acetyltransferase [Tamaricihabitans halophyticus]
MAIEFPLLSERLALRPFRDDDVTAIHRVYGDPEVMRYVAYGKPTSPEETASMVADYIRHQEEYGYSTWVVLDRATGAVIGDAGLVAQEVGAEVGYTLATAYWGKGLATEATRLCVELAFGQLALPQLIACVDPLNPNSARVLRKLGFEHAGQQEAYGRPHDEYRLTAQSWAAATA